MNNSAHEDPTVYTQEGGTYLSDLHRIFPTKVHRIFFSECRREDLSLLDRVDLEDLGYPWKRGGFSKVFKKEISGKEYAIKRIKLSEYKKAADEELEAFQNLEGCEKIVTYCGRKLVEVKGCTRLYILLELCDENLEEAVRKKTKSEGFSEKLVFKDCCEGLEFMHTRKIIHRDVKPTNVLLKLRSGIVVAKIADFGTSVYFGEHTLATLTPTGTRPWQPPEWGLLESRLRPKYDVYSLGLTGFFLATGGKHLLGGAHVSRKVDYDNLIDWSPLDKMIEEGSKRLSRYECYSLKRLLVKMVSFKQEDRPLMNEVKNHRFFASTNKIMDQFEVYKFLSRFTAALDL